MNHRWTPFSRRARTRDLDLGTSSSRASQTRRVRLEYLEDRTLLSNSIPINSSAWTPIGPAGITTSAAQFGGFMGTGGPSSGRIVGIAADPNDANTEYVAAAGGGVWKTTDGANSWRPLTDSQATLFMGSIAVAKSNGNVIYAGTGEANNAYGEAFYGRGVLVSKDGGQSWTLTGALQFNRKTVGSIAISPSDPNTAYAAVSGNGANGTQGGTGIYKTVDGGTTWTNTTGSLSTNDTYSGVVVDPSNPQVVYAAVGTNFGSAANGVYKSSDGGASWAIAGDFPKGEANGRISLAIAASDPKVIVASVANPAGGLKYLLRTANSGTTWTALTATPDYMTLQSDYGNVVAISPTDSNVMFAAGIVDYAKSNGKDVNGIVETRDGGLTWTDITVDVNGIEPHTDHHAMAFDASGRLLEGNDGGIWRLENSLPSAFKWSNINANLQITEFEGTSLDPTNADVVYGGSQDNGTEKFTDSKTWKMLLGGDGGYTAVDPSNPQTVYWEYVNISLFRSDDGGNTYKQVTSGIGKDPVRFYAPYTIDPTNSSHLLYGTDRVYSTNNRGDTWTPLFTPGSNGWTSKQPIQWISISNADPKTVYASTTDAKVFVSSDGGTNWNEHDIPGVSDSVNQILADPVDPKTAYAVRASFNGPGGAGHVFKTTDGGNQWKDISSNLPDIPTESVAVDTRPNNLRLYVGTDTGVYASTDGGASWAPYKTGLPNVQVDTLSLDTNLNVLLAGTHGRGAWEIAATESIGVVASPLNAVEGLALNNVEVAEFNDSTGLKSTSSYTATVNFGDGTPSVTLPNSAIVDLGTGFYGVNASHTYAEEGTFGLTVSLSSAAGSIGQVGSNVIVADAPLTSSPASVAATEGTRFTGVVGTFTDANAVAPTSDFRASISWGDGRVTPGVIASLGGGVFSVTGTNQYADSGTYPVRIVVTDIGGSSTTTDTSAAVADAPLTPTSVRVNTTVGQTVTFNIASFADTAPGDTAADYTVSIDWGDGTTPTTQLTGATITGRGPQTYNVQAKHLYTSFGTKSVKVTVTDEGGATAVANSTVVVADAAITAFPVGFASQEGQVYSGRVATFTSGNSFASVTDFNAPAITWGDGSPTDPSGTIVSLGGGRFAVNGTHTFAEEGVDPVRVEISSKGGSRAQTNVLVKVTDAPIAAIGIPLTGVAGHLLAGPVATFVDSYALAPASDYQAIIDWGDGTAPTPGTIQPGAAGAPYTVLGSHAYARAQTFTVSVTVMDVGGESDTSKSSATTSDAPLVVSTSPINSVTEGGVVSGSVGSFTTANTLAVTKDFIASIDWGDGSSTGGLLTAIGGGTFTITSASPHAYSEEGNYPLTLTVISLGGSRDLSSTTVGVTDAPIVGVPAAPIQAVAGAEFRGVVGVFFEYALAPLSDFSATVDWGDGRSSPGVVAAGPGGSFTVSGGHTYTSFGNPTPRITVHDVGGTTGTFSLGATVNDPPIAAVSHDISAVQGLPFTGTLATFTTPNPFAPAAGFTATVDWGDGTAPTTSMVSGAGGSFTVSGSHIFPFASPGLPVTVTINHGLGGATAAGVARAHILVPISGTLNRASDTGVSNNDGITRVNRPVFQGRAEPGSTVVILAAPSSDPRATRQVGSVLADPAGNWSVQIGPLGDGSYRVTAAMIDTRSGVVVESVGVSVAAVNGAPLVIATTGPTVSSVSFDPRLGQLHLTLQTSAAGIVPSGALSGGSYSLVQPSGVGVQQFAATRVSGAAGPNGQVNVTVSYNIGRSSRTGTFVVMLHAAGLVDLAGNMLNETHFVTFPQAGNSPNPDYVAQIDVSRNMASSAPHTYVSRAEQIAASSYANMTQKNAVVRLPRYYAGNLAAVAAPRPSAFRRKH